MCVPHTFRTVPRPPPRVCAPVDLVLDRGRVPLTWKLRCSSSTPLLLPSRLLNRWRPSRRSIHNQASGFVACSCDKQLVATEERSTRSSGAPDNSLHLHGPPAINGDNITSLPLFTSILYRLSISLPPHNITLIPVTHFVPLVSTQKSGLKQSNTSNSLEESRYLWRHTLIRSTIPKNFEHSFEIIIEIFPYYCFPCWHYLPQNYFHCSIKYFRLHFMRSRILCFGEMKFK